MRRIDAILICVACFGGGGLIYLGFKALGVGDLNAGIWSQVVLVLGLIGWVASYGLRAITHNMTYDQQLKDYKDAVLQKRLTEMSPTELAELIAEVEQERKSPNSP
ncbi:MAG: DUF3007 family protein [Pseudanabaenaceae cyanobacterium bins.68]|nr:DUF3007 family protein [Pseudanabaenaceae cyanobacterium bins.68]